MKLKIITLLAFIMTTICLCSCGHDKSANASVEANNQEKSITQSDEDKANTDSIDISQKEAGGLTPKVDNKKATNTWYLFIIGVIGLLSLAISIASFIKAGENNDTINRHSEEIISINKKLKTHDSEQENLLNSSQKLREQIKKQVSQTPKATPIHVHSASPVSNTPPTKTTKNGYFGSVASLTNRSAYFKKLLNSKDSDARFSAEIIDGAAHFEPIVDLNTIKCHDYMKLAVEFEGVRINDATAMSVRRPGLAQLKDDRWIIKEKALITLKK